jgi:hypothetical protein
MTAAAMAPAVEIAPKILEEATGAGECDSRKSPEGRVSNVEIIHFAS